MLFKNRWAKEVGVWNVARPLCQCLDPQYSDEMQDCDDPKESKQTWTELSLHQESQDTELPAWHRLLELIDGAAADRREEFSPPREMDPADWAQITELPRSISKLKAVRHFIIYGSSLVRIPPEIGEMSSLEEFTPYTSYCLHWFPYEITRCKALKRSTVSTRALYGNRTYRPPFPRLPQFVPAASPDRCSVC